jgi:hypothetical protein
MGTARYFHTNRLWRQVADAERSRQIAEGFQKWNGPDFDTLVQAAERTAALSGDVVEIGCFRGSSGSALLAYMDAAGQSGSCWFFDMFDGFTCDTARSSGDALWEDGHKTEGRDVVAGRLGRFGSDRLRVEVRKADITHDPLPEEIAAIRLANIDVDICEAVRDALTKCAPLMVPGGIMIAEDAGHTPGLIGAVMAIEDFLATEEARRFLPFQVESGQMMFFCLR